MKTRFRFLSSTSNKKTGAAYNRDISFSAGHFKYNSYRKAANELAPLEIVVEKVNTRQAYRKFRRLLINARFFFASDGDMVDYYKEPDNNWFDIYSVDFIWLTNGKVLETFSLEDETNYCLDYRARERFEPLLNYLSILGTEPENKI